MHRVHKLGVGCGSSQPLLVFRQASRPSMSTACPLAGLQCTVRAYTCWLCVVAKWKTETATK